MAPKTFHERMRLAREKAGYTQVEAAVLGSHRLGYRKFSPEIVRRLEGGEPYPIDEERADVEIVAELASLYGTTIDALSEIAAQRLRMLVESLSNHLNA